ncbi:hypothetical protein J2S09_005519 [Bacillus fengqiuensis]|nr:hypothetical protein [Bacillus fengqiuensis]
MFTLIGAIAVVGLISFIATKFKENSNENIGTGPVQFHNPLYDNPGDSSDDGGDAGDSGD